MIDGTTLITSLPVAETVTYLTYPATLITTAWSAWSGTKQSVITKFLGILAPGFLPGRRFSVCTRRDK